LFSVSGNKWKISSSARDLQLVWEALDMRSGNGKEGVGERKGEKGEAGPLEGEGC